MEDLSQIAEEGIEIAHQCEAAAQALANFAPKLADLLRRIGDAPNDEPDAKRQLYDATLAMLGQLDEACKVLGVVRLARKRGA